MSFTFTPLAIADVILIKPKLYKDNRGFFAEVYKASDFRAHGIIDNFVQDNHTHSKAGVLRGLHYQLQPKAQGKLVQVTRGRVFDVAVDIRKGSPTYGKWVSTVLDATDYAMLWIPAGFAHGVFILEDNTTLLYKVTEQYSPLHERTIYWNDPLLNINWPHLNPELSLKDQSALSFSEAENNFFYEPQGTT